MNTESFEDIKSLLDNLDPTALLPDLTTLVGQVAFVTRIAVVAGPVVLMVMGLLYFFAAPGEANYHFGYRCYHGMGSEEAWRFTQRLAGILWGGLGIVLTLVMVVLSAGFADGEIMDVITRGMVCLLWEVAVTVLSCIVINVTVTLRYNRKGERRGAANDREIR